MPQTAPTNSVLALGAWLKNSACLLTDGAAFWSGSHGDLSDPAACAALEVSALQLLAAHGRPIGALAHDLHPDFYSTQLAVDLAARLNVPALGVQHHHAHIAAVVAEHGIDGPVIGLALDGVGLGTDGAAWGGELLWVNGAQWQRLGHLQPLALPGGDRAAREPWRMAASVLHGLGRGAGIAARFEPAVGPVMAAGVQQMLERQLNCPLTSSMGRWFDAAAGSLGLCLHQTDEAQAAMALEAAAARGLAAHPTTEPLAGAVVDAENRLMLGGLLEALFEWPASQTDQAAAGFHLALADALADWALSAARAHGTQNICLGGGCFFNRILRDRLAWRLAQNGCPVFLPRAKGCGDAGLALGQAWVAAQRLSAQPVSSDFHPLTKEPQPCV